MDILPVGIRITERDVCQLRAKAEEMRLNCTKRQYAPRCGRCKLRTMEIAAIHYYREFIYEGRSHSIDIPALNLPKCKNCGEISIDHFAAEEIDIAWHKEVGLEYK